MGGKLSKDDFYVKGEILKTKIGKTNYYIDGPPIESQSPNKIILYLHGMISQLNQFFDISAILKEYGYTFISFDFYGHGHSSNLSRFSYTPDLYITQIRDLLYHLNLSKSKIHIIGYSMGGCVAMHYAIKYHEFIESLMLISPAGLIKEKPKPINLVNHCTYCTVPIVPLCLCQCCISKDRENIQMFNRDDFNKIYPKFIINRFKSQLRRNFKTLLKVAKGMPFWSSQPLLDELNKKQDLKICFFWGELDDVVPIYDALKWIKSSFKENARFIFYSSIRHQIVVEYGNILARDIYSFLQNQIPHGIYKNKIPRYNDSTFVPLDIKPFNELKCFTTTYHEKRET